MTFVHDDRRHDPVGEGVGHPVGEWDDAMREAIALSMSDDVFRSANPRVGCVILDEQGSIVGRGWHRGAGTPHAEVHALAAAGDRARGGTAVVTLEPCDHVGRTGPCSQALLDAGVRTVVYAVADPTPQAAGGAQRLAAAGVDLIQGVLAPEAAYANRAWLNVLTKGRPFVTLKCAMSLDGRVADRSGGPTPITGVEARTYSHGLRRQVDAIVVGTGTVLADDPHLTARDESGTLAGRQPLRVVVGERPIPDTAKVLDDAAETMQVSSHDPGVLMDACGKADVQHLLVEGGPTLATALLDAGLVDEVMWFIAPVILGEGPVSLPSLADPRQIAVDRIEVLGEDVLLMGRVVDVHRDR